MLLTQKVDRLHIVAESRGGDRALHGRRDLVRCMLIWVPNCRIRACSI